MLQNEEFALPRNMGIYKNGTPRSTGITFSTFSTPQALNLEFGNVSVAKHGPTIVFLEDRKSHSYRRGVELKEF